MFTVDEVNKEIENYMKYTSYNIPIIQEIIYEDMTDYYGKVVTQEILESKYIIRFSNSLNECPLEFQKSVIWHEVTHIADIVNNKNMDKTALEGMMSTYSEAHAESIQLRYLLNITSKQKVNQGKRFIWYTKGKEDLGMVTANYINSSYQYLVDFQKTKLPKDFQGFIREFCYFCGYMFLKTQKDAEKLSEHVICKFPKIYQKDMQELYKNILTQNYLGCAAVYTKMKAEAMMTSLGHVINVEDVIRM